MHLPVVIFAIGLPFSGTANTAGMRMGSGGKSYRNVSSSDILIGNVGLFNVLLTVRWFWLICFTAKSTGFEHFPFQRQILGYVFSVLETLGYGMRETAIDCAMLHRVIQCSISSCVYRTFNNWSFTVPPNTTSFLYLQTATCFGVPKHVAVCK